MAIQYVGGRGAGRAGSTSSVNVAINSGLAGGIGSAAIAGDLVIVSVAVATQARNPACGITGYTQLTQQNEATPTYDTSFRVSYKFMPATPDTQVTIPSTGNIADGQGYTIHVFRGVDPTVPLDGVTPQYVTGQGANNRPDPASITPASTGNCLFFGGGGAAQNGTTVFTAAYLSGFLSYNGADTNDGTCGAGYLLGQAAGTPYNGAAFGGGSVNAANSWCATALVLRPYVAPGNNGFQSSSPTERHGTTQDARSANNAIAIKLVCPGSGTQEIAEIGLWVSADAATTGVFRLAIYTHDAANDNPDTMVADSESAELSHNTATVTKKSHTYGTKPQLTGGATYWLAAFFGDANLNNDYASEGGTLVLSSGAATYPTWPTAANWDSATDWTDDVGIYAVYQEAGRTASLAVTLAGCVVAAAATLVATAALAIQLAGATVGSGSTVPVVADLGKTLAGATLSASATAESAAERIADLGVTLAGNSVSSVATAPVVAAASVQLAGVSIASAGTIPVEADLAVGLAGAVLSSGATVQVIADAGINLDGGTLQSGITAPVVANAAVELAGAALFATASGDGSRTAELSVQLAGAAVSSESTAPVVAALSITLDGAGINAASAVFVITTGNKLQFVSRKHKDHFTQ